MKLNLLILSFLLCIVAINVRADDVSKTAISMPSDSAPASSSAFFVKGSVLLSAGTTTNAVLLTQATQGSYVKLKPSLSTDFTASDNLTITGTLDGSIKTFTDPGVRILSDERSYDLKIDVTSFLNDSWEVGSNLSYINMENHIPVLSATSIDSLPQKYSQPEARIYGAYESGSLLYELGGTVAPRRYETTTLDLLGNLYKNSYEEYKLDGKINFKMTKKIKLILKSTAEQRNYTERMAEFSEGLPGATPGSNPLLTTFAQENDVQLKAKMEKFDITSSVSVRFEKDQVYGARDFIRYKLKEKIALPLAKKIGFESEVSVSRQDYSQFRSDPVNDPRNSPLRLDWEGHLTSTAKLELSKHATAQIQYALNRKSSSYALENYLEQVFETGLNLQF